jgi:alpha-beta hydrolase superfamily lysophospholipase
MNQSRFGDLEVLVRMPQGPARATPLLFIHGAYTAAWCWDEHFLSFFAEAGYAAYAVSLSGHGGSHGRDRLDTFSIADYVADVAAVVGRLTSDSTGAPPAPPVLVGHSMGGFVVQKYLEDHDAPGAALVCSVPPQGLMASAFGMMLQKPHLFADLNRLMGGGRVRPDALREAMFAQPVEPEVLQRYLRLSQRESQRAIWDMTLFNLPHPARIKGTPMLIMGAEHDHLIPESLVRMTARSYSLPATILPGLGHGMMLERDWHMAAEAIAAWLEEKGI